jgi:hypothetical protein
MLARLAVRSVLIRKFIRRIPPLLVWVKAALTQVTLPLVFSADALLTTPASSRKARPERELRWMRLR